MQTERRLDSPGALVAGKYRVEGVLGEGGMGYVLSARHLQFDDRVAIKLLHAEAMAIPGVVERFLREGRAARLIKGEHVVGVSDVGVTEDGRPFMVMEFLEGRDLASMLATDGPLSVAEAVDFVLQTCEALVEAHVSGIVHRDLKPANLFVTSRRDGSPCVKVLDFGISKMAAPGHDLSGAGTTRPTAMLGTVLYMSPEQLESSHEVDARTDLWAIGAVLFELLTGMLPFDAADLPKMCVAIMMAEPRSLRALRPDVPEGLERVILTCLRKKRADRFATVADLANALTPYAAPRSWGSVERVVGVARAHRLPVEPELAKTSASLRASAFGIGPTEPPAAPARAPGEEALRASTLAGSVSADELALPKTGGGKLAAVVAVALLVVGVVGVRVLTTSGRGGASAAVPASASSSVATSPVASADGGPAASADGGLVGAAQSVVASASAATSPSKEAASGAATTPRKPAPAPKPTVKPPTAPGKASPDPFQE